jgi:hypothetical protein
MNKLQTLPRILDKAGRRNPIIAGLVILIFLQLFYLLGAAVEKLISGNRSGHWFDLFVILAYITYAAYVVWEWASLNSNAKHEET